MKLTPSQQMMVDDGLPVALILTQAERKAAWDKNPPRNTPWVDPRIEADRQLREQQKKEKTAIRVQKLKASIQRKSQTPLSTKGLRWDVNHCKWVPNRLPTTQEGIEMPKLLVIPFNAEGQEVSRGRTSIQTTATIEEVAAKVMHSYKRGGAAVVTIWVTDEEHPDQAAVAEWKIVDGQPVQVSPVAGVESETTAPEADRAEDAQPAPEGQTEEADMAKKTKAKKTGGTKKPRAKKEGVRAGSKTEIVAKLLRRDTGCTAKQVLEATGWPAVSMPAMAKACGLKLKKEKEKGKPTRYFGE